MIYNTRIMKKRIRYTYSSLRNDSLKGSWMKVHYPKLYNMAHLFTLNVFTVSKGSNNYILFAITAAGVVPCDGPK